MNRHLVFAIAAILLPLGLAGCGNKGPLVLSEPPAEASVPVEQSEPAPAEPAATDAPPGEPAPTGPTPPADARGTPAA
jgi:predicted small lipoprotein YifL